MEKVVEGGTRKYDKGHQGGGDDRYEQRREYRTGAVCSIKGLGDIPFRHEDWSGTS